EARGAIPTRYAATGIGWRYARFLGRRSASDLLARSCGRLDQLAAKHPAEVVVIDRGRSNKRLGEGLTASDSAVVGVELVGQFPGAPGLGRGRAARDLALGLQADCGDRVVALLEGQQLPARPERAHHRRPLAVGHAPAQRVAQLVELAGRAAAALTYTRGPRD